MRYKLRNESENGINNFLDFSVMEKIKYLGINDFFKKDIKNNMT